MLHRHLDFEDDIVIRMIQAIALMAAATTAAANDYPTLERVDHVLTCMRAAGGQTVDNLYACACEIDVIAAGQLRRFLRGAYVRNLQAYAGRKGRPVQG